MRHCSIIAGNLRRPNRFREPLLHPHDHTFMRDAAGAITNTWPTTDRLPEATPPFPAPSDIERNHTRLLRKAVNAYLKPSERNPAIHLARLRPRLLLVQR
ncbi:hypothetical protein DBV08_09415 [Rhodococcus sp. KBW08]|nr:hypothetical protein DBV08_09415 [Rhodococcus sp. KBW08]